MQEIVAETSPYRRGDRDHCYVHSREPQNPAPCDGLVRRQPVVRVSIERHQQQEQRRIHDIALRPTRRAVRQLHKTEGNDEPVRPDQYGRDVSQPVRVEADERRAAHPKDAGGCPNWMKATALARRLRHLISGMRVRAWSVWRSRRCGYGY